LKKKENVISVNRKDKDKATVEESELSHGYCSVESLYRKFGFIMHREKSEIDKTGF